MLRDDMNSSFKSEEIVTSNVTGASRRPSANIAHFEVRSAKDAKEDQSELIEDKGVFVRSESENKVVNEEADLIPTSNTPAFKKEPVSDVVSPMTQKESAKEDVDAEKYPIMNIKIN